MTYPSTDIYLPEKQDTKIVKPHYFRITHCVFDTEMEGYNLMPKTKTKPLPMQDFNNSSKIDLWS